MAAPRVTTARSRELASALADAIDRQAFSGVALVCEGDETLFEFAGGLAHRAEAIPITMGTRFATASGTKGFTALATASLIEAGVIEFATPLVDLLAGDLPNVDRGVTIENLLGHTSGVGDYLDEEELESSDDYVLDIPVHRLLGPEDYLPLLRECVQVEAPGTRFRYNNSGYVLLALAIERASGEPYHDIVRDRVFEPAGMVDTAFLRSDALPSGTAVGYLTDGRTNVLHLPVVGTCDGEAYTTAADMVRFWDALFDGHLVGLDLVDRMVIENDRARIDGGPGKDTYGLGLWLDPDGAGVWLEGMDAGVSFRSGAVPDDGLRFCLIANNAQDVWPIARVIDDCLSVRRTR